ncbi:kisspeptin 2 isoform X2 [Stigmatopora argus]
MMHFMETRRGTTMSSPRMKLAVVVLMYGLMVAPDVGSLGASLSGFSSEQEAQDTGRVLSRRNTAEGSLEPCFSSGENADQRHLPCHQRGDKFNVNPFGLRFGKRHRHGYVNARRRTARHLEAPT